MTGQNGTSDSLDPFCNLRRVLLEAPPANLERLAGRLLGQLFGVPFRIARAGDQRGGDGSVGGAGDRHLIFEARRYAPNSQLNERSIVGEIQQAVRREPALEAWILVTTREVPEQARQTILDSAEENGIGAFIIDWLPQPLPQLAVLCAQYPECFEAEIGEGHTHLLAEIVERQDYDRTLQTIKSEMSAWTIGYESVRQASHTRVREVWESSRQSNARFGQNVAGGEEGSRYVRRPDLTARLDAWLDNAATVQMAALVGPDGVGKTWTAIDWLQSRLDRLPIVVLAPSSTMGGSINSRSALFRFIARYLQDLTEVRTESFWERRVRRILKRPGNEGPAFLFLFDGLNQRASFDWPQVFKLLQDDPFEKRTLSLISARTSFFDERQHQFRMLLEKPRRIEIGKYDLSPGGSFDQRLALDGLSRNDLSDSLIEHAAVPRLFDLVVQLRNSLGDVKEVTVHRLLWAYGASTIASSTGGAFGEHAWRHFIRELAEEYREGNRTSTVRRVTELSEDATLTPDATYNRVSGVIDSIFVNLSEDGDLVFHPDFVHHSLGLALVKNMQGSGSDEDERALLEKFLDPIEGYDSRAEILRAAVAITLQGRSDQRPAWLSTLCTFWIHTQNLPDSHLEELTILASELVSPLLDVIEASEGRSLSTPRYISINTIAGVDKSDPSIAREIAERGARWQRFISLENRGDDDGKNSSYARRRSRLRKRIGYAEIGTVTVAGREFEIVDRRGDDLVVAAAQLLQGRPLKDAVEFFISGVIHTAIVGFEVGQESQSWLNVLNTVDPEETAARLRRASEEFTALPLESGVHADLNKRIASLLLWRTGYSCDAEKARANDPKIGYMGRYETDYLIDPARSFFRLERRHAARVLRDSEISILHKVQRVRDALLDPSFEVPLEFVDAVISTAEEFDFAETAIGRQRTSGDLIWEQLSLALARCAPNKLAEIERKRFLAYAGRTADQRLGTALVATSAMLVAGERESAALRTLRECGKDESEPAEYTILTNILITEIQCEPPVVQVKRIIEADLTAIDLSLAGACDTPSRKELDELLDEFGASEERLSRLAMLLGDHDLTLSDRAFQAFSSLVKPNVSNTELGSVWVLLAWNAPARLGVLLDQSGWRWSSDRHFFENIMGSIAIAASNQASPFVDLAPRIAPAKLLEILSERERSKEDVSFAVELLTAVLLDHTSEPPEPRVVVSHEQGATHSGRYDFTLGDILEDDEDQSDVRRVTERLTSPEKHAEKRRQILQAYIEEVKDIRRAGGQLYLADIKAEDFDPVLKHCPWAVDSWVEGLDTLSEEFTRKVRLAEGFFVALCEALLKHKPAQGVSLWCTLRKCLTTRFVSEIAVDRLLYALFRASPCAQVDAALEEIYGIDEASSDTDLINLVIAARCSGRIDWLRGMVRRDAMSSCPAYQRRAVFLEPLLTVPEIAGDMSWPSGEETGGFERIHQTAWVLGQREAFAVHWLQKFAEAETPEAAHAYWQLFTVCADRRAWVWMRNICESHATKDTRLEAFKQRFVYQERHDLKRAMKENEKSWSGNFAGQKYTKALEPWTSRR